MSNNQVQDLCLYENESINIRLTVYDEDDELQDLTNATVLLVAWTSPDGVTSFTKSSTVASQITIQDQITNRGEAVIFIDPADIAASGLFMYNVWVDLPAGTQHLVVIPSKLEILDSRRS